MKKVSILENVATTIKKIWKESDILPDDIKVTTRTFDDGSLKITERKTVALITVLPTQFSRKLSFEQMRTYYFDVAFIVPDEDIEDFDLFVTDDTSPALPNLHTMGEEIMGALDMLVSAKYDDKYNVVYSPYAQVIAPEWSITDKVGHLTFSVIQRMQNDTQIPSFDGNNLNLKGGIK